MRVSNCHVRRIAAPVTRAAPLLDALASAHDRLWPQRCWPPLRLDRPLAVAARGGHGPIRYTVIEHDPGRRVRFRFDAPAGFDGWHEFRLEADATGTVDLVHDLQMQARAMARLSWPLLFRPLHDALIEDAFACAQAALGETPVVRRWSRWVRLLRRVLAGRRATPQSGLLSSPAGDECAGIVSLSS